MLDITTMLSGIAGFSLSNPDIQRYLLAYRAFRLIFIFKYICCFRIPMELFIKSLKNSANLVFPAIFIIYFYSIVGLYAFNGISMLI